MPLVLIIIILIAFVALCFIVIHYFDIVLIKGVIKRLAGKIQLNKQELTDAARRFLENRALNIAHKAYFTTICTIIGGNSLFSLVEGVITVKKEGNQYQLKLLYDYGLPVWAVLIIILLITVAHIFFLNSKAKRQKTDIIASASAIINEQFRFIPNQEWFRFKTEKAISDLGKSFNLSVNFSYEYFEDAFAATCRDNRVSKVFAKDLKELYTDFSRNKDALVRSIGEQSVLSIERLVLDIQELLTKSQYDGDEPQSVVNDIETIEQLLFEHIRNGNLSYNDYNYTRIHAALGKIHERATNPWIKSISSNVLIVDGQGGCGKTHLLAKLAEARINQDLPTVFFLGRLITDTENPLTQILSVLDVHCKKETFLKALDFYGKNHGRVLFIIDGINEGKGLSLWKAHLLSFINEFEPYRNISIVLSVRTNSDNNWFSRFIKEQQYPSYRHTGFEQNMVGAVEYMFNSFNVPLPSWPLFQREFTNPLLLTLFCRTHSGENYPPVFEGRLETIRNYIKHFNERLSNVFSYSPQTPVLQMTLRSISNTLVNSKSRWFIKREEILNILNHIQGIPDNRDAFIDALVDEGVLNEYDDKDTPRYSFGYDTIGSYLMAETLAKDAPFERLIDNSESVLEALTDLVPQCRNKELFQLSTDDPNYSDYLEELFLRGLPFRTSLTQDGKDYLKNLLKNNDFATSIRVVIDNPFRTDFPISVKTLDALLTPLPMAKRDEVWTQVISDYYDYYDPLLTLAQWGWSASPSVLNNLQRDGLKNIIHLLGWTLSSTFIKLRDTSSRALINILKNNQDLLLDFVKSFGSINDPYITERVYAVVFGCCTGNASREFVLPVAQEVYDSVFKTGNPPEHILIRDYAKCTLDFAVYLGCELDYNHKLINAPYSKEKKNVYVPTEDILKYQLSYDQEDDKQLVTAQNNILDSMCTEYSTRGMYGDFGRYVFQNALDNWDDDIEQISNYGIQMIFEEFGYDARVFKGFDGRHASWERHGNKIERIGKKYEWIALYRIAAILDDNHYGESFDRDWKTPTLYHLRRFDPTILMNPDIRDFTTPLPSYAIPEYDISYGNENKWMLDWRKMPPISQYLDYQNGKDNWICLHAYYTISSLSKGNRQLPIERELWSFIQAFLVNKENCKELCDIINKEGLSGRESSENSDASYSYYREYYWSESYKNQIEAQEYTEREYHIGRKYTRFKVQPAYLLYDISEYADASISESKEMILPSPFLYNGLNLSFSVADGVWLSQDGSVACFDNYWVNKGHAGLFFRKDLLLRFLRDNGKCVVWPVLMERMYKPGGTYWPRIQVGGYAWMGDDGIIHYKFRTYEPSKMEKRLKSIQSTIQKNLHNLKKKGVEKGLVKVSIEEHLEMLSEMEDDNNT